MTGPIVRPSHLRENSLASCALPLTLRTSMAILSPRSRSLQPNNHGQGLCSRVWGPDAVDDHIELPALTDHLHDALQIIAHARFLTESFVPWVTCAGAGVCRIDDRRWNSGVS